MLLKKRIFAPFTSKQEKKACRIAKKKERLFMRNVGYMRKIINGLVFQLSGANKELQTDNFKLFRIKRSTILSAVAFALSLATDSTTYIVPPISFSVIQDTLSFILFHTEKFNCIFADEFTIKMFTTCITGGIFS